MHDVNAEIAYQHWVGWGADAIEAIAVILIVGYIVIATLVWLARSIRRRQLTLQHYESFRGSLGRAMLLGQSPVSSGPRWQLSLLVLFLVSRACTA